MKLATILAVLDGVDGDLAVAATALSLGKAFSARVDGMIARPDPRETMRLAFDGMSPAMIDGILDDVRRESDERTVAARAIFAERCGQLSIPLHEADDDPGGALATWHAVIGNAPELIAGRGRLADVVVVRHPGRDGAPDSLAAIEAVLFDTRRPLLMTAAAETQAVGERIVIGWNGSAEATRAVASARPVLARAKQVTVLAAGDKRRADATVPDAPALCRYLARHDIDARDEVIDPAGRSVGEALLRESEARDADLLIMGAYGRSRLRELVLGGVTRTVLSDATLPVWLAH